MKKIALLFLLFCSSICGLVIHRELELIKNPNLSSAECERIIAGAISKNIVYGKNTFAPESQLVLTEKGLACLSAMILDFIAHITDIDNKNYQPTYINIVINLAVQEFDKSRVSIEHYNRFYFVATLLSEISQVILKHGFGILKNVQPLRSFKMFKTVAQEKNDYINAYWERVNPLLKELSETLSRYEEFKSCGDVLRNYRTHVEPLMEDQEMEDQGKSEIPLKLAVGAAGLLMLSVGGRKAIQEKDIPNRNKWIGISALGGTAFAYTLWKVLSN